MLPGRPSQTMLRTAALRAAHQLLDNPLLLRDPIAVGLVPVSSEHAVFAALDPHRDPLSLRLHFAFRSLTVVANTVPARPPNRDVASLGPAPKCSGRSTPSSVR